MKVAIMQPYFFPYIGQFQLINLSNRFILMDDVQYIRHGWINRNRILNASDEPQYIIAPVVKQPKQAMIKMVNVIDGNKWKNTILGQLTNYKRNSPYYAQVISVMKDCMNYECTNITRLNKYYFEKVCSYIGINHQIEVASDLNFDYSEIRETQDWALQLSKQTKATTYFNAPGGEALYDPKKFNELGIELNLVKPKLSPYNQFRNEFVPALSILDVMMFNSPSEIREMLNDYTIL